LATLQCFKQALLPAGFDWPICACAPIQRPSTIAKDAKHK